MGSINLCDLPDGLSRNFRVQSLCKKFSAFAVGQITFTNSPVRLTEGRLAIVTNAGRDAMDAGGASDESACLRTAKSCGPDAPTLASSS
jgi:hypothetical protein